MRLFWVLLGLVCVNLAQCQRSNAQRELVDRQPPYYWTTDSAVLGAPNHTAALGNPLKGLFGSIRWSKPPLIDTIPLSLEWFNLGLGKVDVGIQLNPTCVELHQILFCSLTVRYFSRGHGRL